MFGALCCGTIGGLVGFYVSNGLVYLGARLSGGNGDFTTQVYLLSLFTVPLGIVLSLVGLVPFVGVFISFAVSAYGFILNVRAVKVTHGLSTGRAVAAILVPVLVIVMLVVCLFPALMAVFADFVQSGP